MNYQVVVLKRNFMKIYGNFFLLLAIGRRKKSKGVARSGIGLYFSRQVIVQAVLQGYKLVVVERFNV